jgi:hypothetical protein
VLRLATLRIPKRPNFLADERASPALGLFRTVREPVDVCGGDAVCFGERRLRFALHALLTISSFSSAESLVYWRAGFGALAGMRQTMRRSAAFGNASNVKTLKAPAQRRSSA